MTKKIKVIIRSEAAKNKMLLFPLVISFVMFVGAVSVSARGFGLVKDIYPGYHSSFVTYLRADSAMFFWAEDAYGSASRELWISKGSTDGTVKISSVDRSFYYTPGRSTDIAVGNKYFFSLSRSDVSQYELWVADGIIVKKLIDLPGYLDDRYYPAGSGGLFFFVPWHDDDYGRELWVSDGTTAGTMRLTDINPGPSDSSPHDLTDVNGILYFVVGTNVWKSDGTPSGTALVINFDDTHSTDLVAVANDTLYIRRIPVVEPAQAQLWRHEAVLAQTSRVITFTNLPEETNHYAAVGNILYFVNNTIESPNPLQYGLWKTDGTEGGTVLLKEWSGATGSTATRLTNVGGLLFFRGGDDSNRQLWTSDGTSSGTVLVKDINDDVETDSDLRCLTALGNTLFFTHADTTSYFWMSDGTTAGTVLTDFTVDSLKCPVVLNEKLYFYGNDSTTSEYGAEFYSYDPSNEVPLVPMIMLLLNK